MDPWTRPIMDVFEEKYTKNEIEKLIQNNVIEISPLAFMRGRTFKNAFIIADEMQNSSPSQMLMLTTRIGDNSKMIVTGDIKQSDRPNKSGLIDFLQKFYNYRNNYIKEIDNMNISANDFFKTTGIQVVELQNKDIQRSDVVKKILEIYDDTIPSDNIINNYPVIINKQSNSTINSITDCALIPRHLESVKYKEFIKKTSFRLP